MPSPECPDPARLLDFTLGKLPVGSVRPFTDAEIQKIGTLFGS